MNLLLDSHVLVWLIAGDPRLPEAILEIIKDSNNVLFVSLASFWELSTKLAQGRLRFPNGMQSLVDLMNKWSMQLVPIRLEHVTAAAQLPFHHGDPFDRMLIAQSVTEGFRLVSGDELIHQYMVEVLWP